MMQFLSIFGSSSKANTFKPYVVHGNAKRATLGNISRATLGVGNILLSVKLQRNEDQNEWLASHSVDFFNEVSLLWGIVADVGLGEIQDIGYGFPIGFEYRWADTSKEDPIRLSGPDYVDKILTWVEREINDPYLFPTSESDPFPRKYMSSVRKIFTRLFRVYAIVYTNFFSQIEAAGAVPHLNTSFKHFMFFVWEFDLIEEREFAAIPELIAELRTKYNENN